jgi:hypothetical protein
MPSIRRPRPAGQLPKPPPPPPTGPAPLFEGWAL